MIRPETDHWGQTADDLRRLALNAEHPRTRERFAALFQLAAGSHSASGWAKATGRRPETVLGWVRDYNRGGPDVLAYRRTGGRRPLFRPTGSATSPTPPSTPTRPTTACPATAGPSRSSATGSPRPSGSWPAATPSAGPSAGPG